MWFGFLTDSYIDKYIDQTINIRLQDILKSALCLNDIINSKF